MLISEAATKWGVSERAVRDMCIAGRILGAEKHNGKWVLPDDAVRPDDGRIKTGEYIKTKSQAMPIGVSDYIRAQSDYYYVDKTLLIKEILDQKSLVTLFTRPRRFGKTLNMDMLRVFFEISSDDTEKYFKDKKIAKFGKKYMDYQGKYPVIFLSFKDVKFDTWEETFDKLSELVQVEFGRHQELMTSDALLDYEKEYYSKVLSKSANKVELSSALENLSRMLNNHYGAAPIIIIDEYDTPIQEGYSKDFYGDIIDFMRNFFSGGFKDNKNLSFGFLTGILRIAQESIFSGLNNITVNTIMDDEYSEFFGFTKGEVADILYDFGMGENISEAEKWYNGYCFGSTEIFNPWSIINYVSKNGLPQAYWVSTGKNEVLEDVLNVATEDISERLNMLLLGEKVIARIDQNVVYRSLTENPANIYSLLLMAGYLKPVNKQIQMDGSYLCEIEIPNQEIAAVFKIEIMSHLLQVGAVQQSTANRIAESLYARDFVLLQQALVEYMNKSMSFYDASAEGFYHGLTLGIVAMMDNTYRIKSNRESGDGRFDLALFPRENQYPGIIMEFKWKNNLSEKALSDLAEEALTQISAKSYDIEMKDLGVAETIKIGAAFSGKNVVIKTL
ncbi:ATP-binding protein [Butyrivibrio fibrisolvens]|uniref:AAA family ATPase n=1 Tax=Pseudobutyrivibrio ruminis TaxID=46206 RepID=UPI0003F6D83C|nr:AAA family ATPase [Pseudobutyrivibrio ruminis]MDC7278799.1 ATP-binding protein [Butyrivibrio fibrisolvens]